MKLLLLLLLSLRTFAEPRVDRTMIFIANSLQLRFVPSTAEFRVYTCTVWQKILLSSERSQIVTASYTRLESTSHSCIFTYCSKARKHSWERRLKSWPCNFLPPLLSLSLSLCNRFYIPPTTIRCKNLCTRCPGETYFRFISIWTRRLKSARVIEKTTRTRLSRSPLLFFVFSKRERGARGSAFILTNRSFSFHPFYSACFRASCSLLPSF